MIELSLTVEAARALAESLGIDPDDHGVHSILQNPQLWTRLDAGRYSFYSQRANQTYTVTAETCECPAYTKPVEAGDPPRLCYHRKGVQILNAAEDAVEQARREEALARYRATMDAADLPADLPRVVPPPVAGLDQAVMDEADWIEFQASKGMIILPDAGRGTRRRS